MAEDSDINVNTNADSDNSNVCTTCKTTEKLKRCAKCNTTLYCSRECQKADWKSHKKLCSKNAAATAAAAAVNETSSNATNTTSSQRPTPKNLSAYVEKPFTCLNNGTWLHDRPERDVYKLLIDTYRFRMEDNYMLEGDVGDDGIYAGHPNGLPGFKRFLRLAVSRPGLLPTWWNKEKEEECKAFGMRGGEWSDLRCSIEKRDIIEHYGDNVMPMQLRMFGESVYGRGPGGQNGTAMRQMMMSTEHGDTVASAL
jgi:mitochondrial splicing suppressor protein 51